MLGLRAIKILPVLIALILIVNGHESSEEVYDTTSTINTDTTVDLTSLERAHWCRFSNGTYIPLGFSFMHTQCSLCQCTKSRLIRCQSLQCMPTYCIDNSMPYRPVGQCCTVCKYEAPTNTSCVYNGITLPHGVIIKSVGDKTQCWCQLGNIECRNYMTAQTADLLSDGMAAYIIVIVLIVVLIFGLLLCCTCTVGFYYYYQRNQQAFQQAYDEYVNSAGWQPMNEGEENIIDSNAEEKRLEAEQYQYTNTFDNTVPPPYAAYNGTYVSEQEQK